MKRVTLDMTVKKLRKYIKIFPKFPSQFTCLSQKKQLFIQFYCEFVYWIPRSILWRRFNFLSKSCLWRYKLVLKQRWKPWHNLYLFALFICYFLLSYSSLLKLFRLIICILFWILIRKNLPKNQKVKNQKKLFISRV